MDERTSKMNYTLLLDGSTMSEEVFYEEFRKIVGIPFEIWMHKRTTSLDGGNEWREWYDDNFILYDSPYSTPKLYKKEKETPLCEDDLVELGFEKKMMAGTGWRSTTSMCDPIYYYTKGRITINATSIWTWFLDGEQRNDIAVDTKQELIKLVTETYHEKESKMNNFVSQHCKGEKCQICGHDAAHKIAEVIFDDDPFRGRHELTSYVCDKHFAVIFKPQTDDRLALYNQYIEYAAEALKKTGESLSYSEWLEQMVIDLRKAYEPKYNCTTCAYYNHGLKSTYCEDCHNCGKWELLITK